MRKIMIAVAGLILVSCTKEMQMASVTFSPSVESYSMTKATRADTIQSIVASKLPSEMSIRLTSAKTATQYETTTGVPVRVPVGEYTVYGKTTSPKALDLDRMHSCISNVPEIEAMESVVLTSGENNKTLRARFTCFGIVIDTREVERFTIRTTYQPETDVPMEYEGNYGIAFVVGKFPQYCEFKAYPKDRENNDARGVRVVTDSKYQGQVVAQPGNYYVFHPASVEKVEAGFGVDIPTMGEIDVL